MMRVRVNGEPRSVPEGSSIGSLVDICAPSRRGIAVARNGDVVPRSSWDTVAVAPDDAVEILGAAQGG